VAVIRALGFEYYRSKGGLAPTYLTRSLSFQVNDLEAIKSIPMCTF